VAGQEYHYPGLCVIARKPPRLHYGVVFVARSPVGSLGAQAARLGHKPNVSVFAFILPRRFLAGFLCQGAIVGSYNAHKNEISTTKFPLFFSGLKLPLY